MKNLLAITAIIESLTGLLLVVFPTKLTFLLLGSTLDGSAAFTVARIAGVALIALGIVCWMSRNENKGSVMKGIITGLIVYNAGVVSVLAHTEIESGLSGIGLWPVVLVHFVMAIWCGLSLVNRPA
jgi:hypothetical protein